LLFLSFLYKLLSVLFSFPSKESRSLPPFPGEPQLEGPEGTCGPINIFFDDLTNQQPAMFSLLPLAAKQLPDPSLPELAILRPDAEPGTPGPTTKPDLSDPVLLRTAKKDLAWHVVPNFLL